MIAIKGDQRLVFEVKPSLDIRGLGQSSWYSYYIKKVSPGTKTYLAFSCHEFNSLKYPEVRAFFRVLNENYGLNLCGVRDPDGPIPGGVKLFTPSVKWYEICMGCPHNMGFFFYDHLKGKIFQIEEDQVQTFEMHLQQQYRALLERKFPKMFD